MMRFHIFLLSFIWIQPIFSQNINKDSLAFELCQIYASDQSIRNIELTKSFQKEMSVIVGVLDSINFEKVIAVISKYGFPSEHILGGYIAFECVAGAVTAVLLHCPHRLLEANVYNLLKREVIRGNLSAQSLAVYLDKYYVTYEKRSLFNSPFKEWTKAKGVCLRDKEDSEKVRRDIGLEPLADSIYIDCDAF